MSKNRFFSLFAKDSAPVSLPVRDGLKNVVANLGTSRDKAAHTSYTFAKESPADLVAAYETSWLAAATVDYPVEDALRKWRSWRAEAGQISAIEAEEKRLNLRSRVQDAVIASRLLGGAAIYASTGADDPSKPLDPTEKISSLVVLGKDELNAGEVVKDIDSPYYGKPEFYTVTSGDNAAQVSIHASRFAIFNGVKTHGTRFSGSLDSWGDSVLQRSISGIKSADSIAANINSLVFEANVDVMKVQGFADMLAQNQDDLILRRAHLQAVMKGNNGMLMMDAQDSYERNTISFGGLSDLMLRFFDLASGASGIPVTRLFGRAVSGLTGGGDGDERIYYDRCGDIQSKDVGPAIALIDQCIINSALGSIPPEVYYEWTPLRQKTEDEIAEIFSKCATAARSLAGQNAGEIVPLDALSDAMVNALTESGALPGLEGYVQKYGTLSEQDDLGGPENLNIIDAAPRTLYVSRSITNADEILAHYREQGVDGLIEPGDMHVTITYSRQPVDWMRMGEAWQGDMELPAGGARLMEAFGPGHDTLVLAFASSQLSWRHEEMVQAGASWDWPEYQPHITIAYEFDGSLDDVDPWRGEIKLGPEIFEEVNENWRDS